MNGLISLEKEDTVYNIQIDNITRKEEFYTYELTIIEHESSITKVNIDGFQNLVLLIKNIEIDGFAATENIDKLEDTNDIDFNELEELSDINYNISNILELHEHISHFNNKSKTSINFELVIAEECSDLAYNEIKAWGKDGNRYIITHNLDIDEDEDEYEYEYEYEYEEEEDKITSYSVYKHNDVSSELEIIANDIRTKTDVLNIILDRNNKDGIREQKLRSTNMLLGMYYKEISTLLNTLSYTLQDLDCEQLKENYYSLTESITCICEIALSTVEWIKPYGKRRFMHRDYRDFRDMKNFKEELDLLIEQNDTLKQKVDITNLRNDKNEISKITAFISQVNWACLKFNLFE